MLAIIAYGASFKATAASGSLDLVVTDLCSKRIVLLGEDSNHGSGKTIETKVQLVKKLINECDFSAVFFESPVYEFTHFNRAASASIATEIQLAQSIGGMWSTTQSIAALLPYLLRKANKGAVTLAGIDPQVGANQPFSQGQLGKRFSSYLPISRRQDCERELYRYLNWQYGEEHTYNEATITRIITCIHEAKVGAEQILERTEEVIADRYMLANFSKYLALPQGNYFNSRDRAMADNIIQHISHLAPDAKVIVWCASIHAAITLKPLSSSNVPMGSYLHQAFQHQVASIGFTALTGSFGRSKPQTQVIRPAALARKVLADGDLDSTYLNKQSLAQMGSISAQPISYNDAIKADWSKILDGIFVLKEESAIVIR